MQAKTEDIYDPYVRFDPTNQIHYTAIIYDNVQMGKNNVIGPYSVIGSNGEIRNCKDFQGAVIIGDNNIISEHVTIQRPATKGATTKIGNGNMIMAHAHLGHDVQIEDNCEVCSGVILGGYVRVETGVKIKLGAIIRNRKIVCKNSLVGLGSAVVKDVEENTTVAGVPAKPLIKNKTNAISRLLYCFQWLRVIRKRDKTNS